GYEEAGQSQLDGERQGLTDELTHRHVPAEGLPEVSLGDVLQEGEVLDRQRPVQSQHGCVLLSGGEIAGIVVAREHETDRVPRHDAENREDDHGHSEEDDRRLAQTLEYESRHRMVSRSRTRRGARTG